MKVLIWGLHYSIVVFLQQLAESLQAQSNITDASERTRVQTNALRSGIIFQNLGALLLELGRTTMTLRMGETPVWFPISLIILYNILFLI